MKAIINSEILHLASKLVKTELIEVLVENKEVKVIVAESTENFNNQVIIDSPYYGNEEDGAVMIPAYLIKLLEKKENIEVTNGLIKAENREIKFKSEGEIYKEIKESSSPNLLIKDFNKVTQVKYALAQDLTRPVLTCVCINGTDVVALDDCRMAVTSVKEELTSSELLIPKDIIKMHGKLKDKSIVSITEADIYLIFNFGNIKIIRKKEDGKFVNYRTLFPKEEDSKTHLRIDASVLYKMCNSIQKTSLDTHHLIKINLNKEESYITAKDCSSEVKSYLKEYELEGNDIEIGVDSKLLVEALKRYEGIIDVYFNTPVTPIILKNGKGKKDLILPIRLIRQDSKVIELNR